MFASTWGALAKAITSKVSQPQMPWTPYSTAGQPGHSSHAGGPPPAPGAFHRNASRRSISRRGIPHRGIPHRGIPHRGIPHRSASQIESEIPATSNPQNKTASGRAARRDSPMATASEAQQAMAPAPHRQGSQVDRVMARLWNWSAELASGHGNIYRDESG